MNGKQHLLLGGAIGFCGYIAYRLVEEKPIDLLELILFSIGGAIVGILPDILEPATNPNHRSFFHSIISLLLLLCGDYILLQNEGVSEELKALITTLSMAYGSHLLADSSTPKGLPFFR
jgi:membrane-bound metal-dependent hydrolase YbcI (DUF457 family)